MNPARAGGPGVTPIQPLDDAHAKLRRAAHQLEGVFVRQLFQAMRESGPSAGLLGGGAGEQMFTSLMDDALADTAAQRLERGIGEALYRQLSRSLPPAPEAPASPERKPDP
jgi:Rod binding domain-containing protein